MLEKIVKIVTYLKTKQAILYFTFLILALFAFIFYIGNLNFAYYWLALQIALFFLIVFLIINYFFYRSELKKEKLIINLKTELLKQNELTLKNKEELDNYFLLWLHQIKTPLTKANLLIKKENNHELATSLVDIENYINMAMSYLKLKEIKPDCDISLISLNTCLNNILVKYRYQFINKHLNLNYDFEDVYVISDSRYLEILLEQFISNALKYTDSGSISLIFKKENNSLAIIDTGRGILDQDLPKIFDCGYSGYNGRYNQKSSGLGLFLAKEIAHKLNIKIAVISSYQKGSTFTLYFPKFTKL